jgi:hypothetical protein
MSVVNVKTGGPTRVSPQNNVAWGRDSSSERGRTLARGNVVLSIFGTGVGNFPFTLTRLTV